MATHVELLKRRISALESTLREIREFSKERAGLGWEEHGDEFRKLAKMAEDVLGDEEGA